MQYKLSPLERLGDNGFLRVMLFTCLYCYCFCNESFLTLLCIAFVLCVYIKRMCIQFVTLAPNQYVPGRFTFDMSNKQVLSECSSNSSPEFEQAVANAISPSLGEITSKVTSIIDSRFESFKREIHQQNSATVEEALIR